MDWLDDDGSWAVHHVMGFSLAIVASPYFTCCNAFAWILRNARKWSIWNCLILTYLYSKSDSVTLEMMCNAWSPLLCVWDPDHWLVLSTLCMRPRSLIGPLYFVYETQIIDWSSLICEFFDGLRYTNCFLYKSQWSRLRSTCMSTWLDLISNHTMVYSVKYSAMM